MKKIDFTHVIAVLIALLAFEIIKKMFLDEQLNKLLSPKSNYEDVDFEDDEEI